MTWQLEKLLQEHDAKLSAGDKDAVTKSIERVRAAAKGDDAEAIKSALHELEQASHALSKTLYAKAGGQPGGPGARPPATRTARRGRPGRRRGRADRRGV